MKRRSEKLLQWSWMQIFIILIISLVLSSFLVCAWEKEGGGNIKVSGFLGEDATNLWDYYTAWGKTLPSLNERAKMYEALGFGSVGSYVGSAYQNTQLLNDFKQKQICPLTVEELGITTSTTSLTTTTVSTVISPTVGSFSVTIPSKGSGTTSFSVHNPNSFPITVTGFQIINYDGFNGYINPTNLPLEIGAYSTKYVQLDVIDNGGSSNTYSIKFRLSGTP